VANHRRIKIVAAFASLTVLLLAFFLWRYPGRTADREPVSPPYQRQTYFAHTQQELAVHFLSGREKGPTLLIFGGIHGDEKAGYLAAERYADLQLRRGNLILAPRLNAVAIKRRQRQGLGGDMNRLFDLSEKERQHNPDARVVEVAKGLIGRADVVINLHQAYDFYSHRWISRQRNPSKWGQCNVIDTPIFQLHNGEIIEPGRFAQRVSKRSNERIRNPHFHFLVNNTNTHATRSMHKEQRGSLTYYALTKQHKIALAFEATKNCSLPEAIAYLTVAVNSALAEMGIVAVSLPAEEAAVIRQELKGQGRP
jgi:hypothetical protein